MLFRAQPEEFHTIAVAGAVAHYAADTNGLTRVRRSKLHEDFISVFQFHAGKDQQAALADVTAPAIDDRGFFTMNNDTERQVKLVALPTPLY